jgi:hypothetical protein
VERHPPVEGKDARMLPVRAAVVRSAPGDPQRGTNDA